MFVLFFIQAEGYAIWIDIEKMGGSTLEAMAHAVENAAVVLICMSEKYKQSPNCRTGMYSNDNRHMENHKSMFICHFFKNEV